MKPALRALALAVPILATSAVHATEARKAGEGVLCAYALYTGAQFIMDVCDYDPLPINDALDRAVAAIEVYILANASDPGIVASTRANLLSAKEMANAWSASERSAYCESNKNLGPSLQRQTVEEFERYVADMLAKPGEPTLGSCL